MIPAEVWYSVVVTLVGAVVALWRLRERDHAQRLREQKEASKLIFALLGKMYELQGRQPPTTKSHWVGELEKLTPPVLREQFSEAQRHAIEALDGNGEVERLVRSYLRSDPPPGSET